MRPIYFIGLLLALAVASSVIWLSSKGPVASPQATAPAHAATRAANGAGDVGGLQAKVSTGTSPSKIAGELYPPQTPEYARTLQGIITAAQPKSEPGHIKVTFCAAGRQGNEHFCGWVNTKGQCMAGFIQEQPGSGTVPVQVGKVPIPEEDCTFYGVFNWLKK